MNIPVLNHIGRQVKVEKKEYPENAEDMNYMVLFPEDYEGFGKDVSGNLAILLNEENAREVKRLAEEIIETLE